MASNLEFASYFVVLLLLLNVQTLLAVNDAENLAEKHHMKPLGSHVPPDPVDEVFINNPISPKEFAEKYVLPSRPVVLRGMAKSWPAFGKWTDEYLRTEYKRMEVRIEGRVDLGPAIPQGDVCLGRDTLANFVNTYHQPNVNKYVVSQLPTPMWKDVHVPTVMNCGNFLDSFVDINLWFNSGGAVSVLHKDPFNTMNCIVNGSKEWKLIDLQYSNLVHHASDKWADISQIDINKVDMKKFPNIAKIPHWFHTVVHAGDCLHVPTQMWHQVNSAGEQNIAVALLFSNFPGVTPSDLVLEKCNLNAEYIPLSTIDVDWQYHGTGRMHMGMPRLHVFAQNFTTIFSKEGYLSKQLLVDAIAAHTVNPANLRQKVIELYTLLNNLSPTGNLTLSQVSNLTRDQLRIVMPYFMAHEPGFTYEHEYSFFTPEEIEDIARGLAHENDNVLRKIDFKQLYISKGGSEKFALDIWTKLAGDLTEISMDTAEAKMEAAVWMYEVYRNTQTLELVPGADYNTDPKSKEPGFFHKSDFLETESDELLRKSEL